jgi:tRNA-dihydrouridine synthase
MLFNECHLRGRRIAPARFCAPLAGYTHSAFRRLLAELGGCGAIWTEMVAARRILGEDFATLPWLRRRPEEGLVVYQLMVREGDPLDRILGRLAEAGVEAVDLNLACDAHNIRAMESGSALWDNFPVMRAAVESARHHWPGLLAAKIRLGHRAPGWQAGFTERMKFLEGAGVDAVIVHPRFFEDKFGRRAQLELIPWVAEQTRLPIIANGDLTGPAHVASLAHLQPASAIMLGRMAVACPWVFAHWEAGAPPAVDHRLIWNKLCDYIEEDFPPVTALRRIKMFAKYFAINFMFGHQFYTSVGRHPTMREARAAAAEFFALNPALERQPTIAGLR